MVNTNLFKRGLPYPFLVGRGRAIGLAARCQPHSLFLRGNHFTQAPLIGVRARTTDQRE